MATRCTIEFVGEFDTVTENAILKQRIVERIEREGGISFRDFMEMALYEPGLGYYAAGRDTVGRAGDFVTSPELSPLFGAMIGRQLREMWEILGRPAMFDAVEAGPGSGLLARDILAWASRTSPDFAEVLRYALVEMNDEAAARQQTLLERDGLTGPARWMTSVPSGVVGCVFSNELLDAMPVRRVKVEGGALREVCVTWSGSAFAEEVRDPEQSLGRYFESLALLPGEGCYAEVNTTAIDWTRNAAAAIERGFLMTIDYGYEAPEFYAPWRTDGTLLCFYGHNASTDPYVRVGRQDMTSHVDFTSVRRAGEEVGLRTLGMVTQSEFLANLGIGEALGEVSGPRVEEYFARRQSVTHLLDPGGLGRIKVLVQSKGVEDARLTGLGDADA
jgi:SAM-dependent MidA family methyltransferase